MSEVLQNRFVRLIKSGCIGSGETALVFTDWDTHVSPMSETKSESAGVVKISSDGVVVVPVEVREVLGIKNKEAYVRLKNIEVAEIIDEDDDITLEDAKGGDQ